MLYWVRLESQYDVMPGVAVAGCVNTARFSRSVAVLSNGFTKLVGVESVVPSEVFLNVDRLRDNGGATIEDVAASLADYRYRQNIGAYVPRSAVEQDLLDQKEFAAVFGTTFLESLAGRDLAEYGDTAYADGDPDGMPGPLI